ncbi:MAG: hypothetical protein WBQ89_18155 [Candidatus Acidiferrum sp.]
MGCIRNRRDNQKQDQFSHEQIQGERATESYAAVQRTQQLLPNASSNAQIRQIRGAVARFVLILLMLAAGGSTLKLYIVQELITGLFFVAITVTTIFALTVAFVLCQEGILHTVPWAKNVFAALGRFVPHQNGSQDPMASGPTTVSNDATNEGFPVLTQPKNRLVSASTMVHSGRGITNDMSVLSVLTPNRIASDQIHQKQSSVDLSVR